VHPLAERRFLEQIAQLSGKPELSYAPDEDMFDLDPTANAWDNSDDVLRYSQSQLDNARAGIVLTSVIQPRESYSELSELFNKVFHSSTEHLFHHEIHWRTVVLRSYAGDRNGQLPLKRYLWRNNGRLWQRCKSISCRGCFQIPPELLNKLAPSRWRHWGKEVIVGRLDYPIHDSIYLAQRLVLKELLSGDRPDSFARHRTQKPAWAGAHTAGVV